MSIMYISGVPGMRYESLVLRGEGASKGEKKSQMRGRNNWLNIIAKDKGLTCVVVRLPLLLLPLSAGLTPLRREDEVSRDRKSVV